MNRGIQFLLFLSLELVASSPRLPLCRTDMAAPRPRCGVVLPEIALLPTHVVLAVADPDLVSAFEVATAGSFPEQG